MAIKIEKVVGNRALLRRHNVETTVGRAGIILAPETRIDQSLRCTVIKVGPGKSIGGKVVPPDIKPGDVVILTTFSGEKVVPIQDEQVIIVDIDWIEAVMPDESPDPKAMEMING